MTDKVIKNNQVTVAGKIVSKAEFSHEVCKEGFYIFDLEVSRLSDSVDYIPVMISERIMDFDKYITGSEIEVNGQFRSYNKHDDDKNRLMLTVFAREIEEIDEDYNKNPNSIYLDGYVCKPPVYRTTPLGREIADLLLAVNRPYGKSDYIPCICWGRNARFAEKFEVGTHIQIWGRIQSREYQKKIDENNVEQRVAYEVSVTKMEYPES